MLAGNLAAQEHRWAGRNLDEIEWTIHEKLAVIPHHGVFDDIRFELENGTVKLSGQVLKESVKHNAERAIRRIDGVQNVINQIEVLPPSQRDNALRMNLYRAIYEKAPLEKYATRDTPSIHIIVKNGWATLEGVVDSDADRALVHQRALHVTAHISDNLRVASQES